MKLKNALVVLSIALAVGGCAASNTNFPSVLGNSEQESLVLRGNRAIKSVFTGKTETFGTQKVITLTEDMNKLVYSINANEQQYQTTHNVIAVTKDEYYEKSQIIEKKLNEGVAPKNDELYQLLKEAQNKIKAVSDNIDTLNRLSAESGADVRELNVFIKTVKNASTNSSATLADKKNMQKLHSKAEDLLLKAAKLQEDIVEDDEKQEVYLFQSRKELDNFNEAITAGGFDKVSKYEKIIPLFIRKNIP